MWRRPDQDDIIQYKDYVPCVKCLAFVTKKEMWRHLKTCPNKGQETSGNEVAQCEMILYSNKYSLGASNELSALLLDKMIKDDIFEIVSNDQLITTYGSFLLGDVSGFRKLNNISNRLCVLGRLIKNIREKADTAVTLQDIIAPDYFDRVLHTLWL